VVDAVRAEAEVEAEVEAEGSLLEVRKHTGTFQ